MPDSWTMFESSLGVTRAFRIARWQTESRADFALSGKASGLVLREPDGTEVSPFTAASTVKDEYKPFNFRTATARLASEALTLAGLPIREPVAAESREVMLDGLYLDLLPGRVVSVRGERADAEGIEEAETGIVSDVRRMSAATPA